MFQVFAVLSLLVASCTAQLLAHGPAIVGHAGSYQVALPDDRIHTVNYHVDGDSG